jgi:hypothetical protein
MDSEEPMWQEAKKSGNGILVGSVIISAAMLIFAGMQWYLAKTAARVVAPAVQAGAMDTASLQEEVTPSQGVTLPATWGDLGKRMVDAGVIDEAQFKVLYLQRGGLPQDIQALLDESNNGQITINTENSGMILNLLWAFGMSNKNPILDAGPMQDPQYGGAGGFASTGGWTLAKGNAMDYYSKLDLVPLTADEQSLVDTVAKNIYRPCCGNSAYFPDCNHGMAMLGLLELMASQGATADEMYKAALAVNSYWFPENYLTIAGYLQGKGITWGAVKPQDLLAANFSSAAGYQQIVARAQSAVSASPGGCGV